MAMQFDETPLDSTLSRSAQICWRVSRVITGLLRAHPNLRYRRDYSPLSGTYGRVRGGFLACAAGLRGTRAQSFAEELRRVARELDDVRALTWSVELSETFGRALQQMRRLRQELDAAALLETGARNETAARLESGVTGGRHAPKDVANWPYLAF